MIRSDVARGLLVAALLSFVACGEDEPTSGPLVPPNDVHAGAGGAAPTKGGSSGKGGAAASGGAAGGVGKPLGCPEAEPRNRAKIVVVQRTIQAETVASTTAIFPLVTVVEPGRTCIERIEEACRVEVCTVPAVTAIPCEDERATAVDAGPLTVTGAKGSRTLLFQPTGDSPGYPKDVGTPLFLGGETVSVAAAGGVVPAFGASLRAPVVVTFPTLSEKLLIERAKGLSFSWMGDAVAPVIAAFSAYQIIEGTSSAKTFSVACTFAGSAPNAKIPASALTDLPVGSVSFLVAQAATTVVSVGQWDIDVGVFANTIEYGAILE